MLKKTLESPLNWKETQSVNPKKNQPWIFIGRTDAEVPVLGPRDAKSWFTEKDPNVGKDWKQEENGARENELVGWHHWLSGHEFQHSPGDSGGQRSWASCSTWDHKESYMTLVTEQWQHGQYVNIINNKTIACITINQLMNHY